MSTAEAVSVAHAVGIKAWYLRGGSAEAGDIVDCMAGAAAKDNSEDLARLRRYLEQKAPQAQRPALAVAYQARNLLPG